MLFPGQGAALGHSVRDWYDDSTSVQRLINHAAAQTGVAVGEVFARSGRALTRTELLQPVLVALCLGIYDELIDRGVTPVIVAGHSLGEIAACAAAGCFSPDDAVALAATRGRLMEREARRYPGGMVAVRADLAALEVALEDARKVGIVEIASYNTAEQISVSGQWAALRKIAGRFQGSPIGVAGPWHTAALAGAVDEFRHAAKRVMAAAPVIPLVSNRSGRLIGPRDDLPDLLAGQLTNPVQWKRTMHTILANDVGTWVTVGPSRALRGFARECDGDSVQILSIASPRDLAICEASLSR